jgi:hypothetical protein
MKSQQNPTQIQVAVETETYVNVSTVPGTYRQMLGLLELISQGPYDNSYPDNRKDEDSLSDTEPKVVAYSSQAQLTDPHRI